MRKSRIMITLYALNSVLCVLFALDATEKWQIMFNTLAAVSWAYLYFKHNAE